MFSTMTTLCDRRGVDGRASHGVNGEGRVGGGAKASRWRSVRLEHQFMDRRAWSILSDSHACLHRF